MASNRRELVLALVSDSSQFNRGLDQAEGKLKSIGKTADKQAGSGGGMGKLGSRVQSVSASFGALGAVASGAALYKVGQFAQDSVRAFSDLNESTNAVQVTFGKAADGILELGENAAHAVGLSNAEFNSLSVSFSAFVDNIAGAGGQSVVNVMDDLTTRVADFASVMNIDVVEAAEKFRSGLAGETEPLRKFGLDLSAAAVNAKALELGLTGANNPLTEQEKILVRYQLLMDQTDKTAGDFANTAGDLANQQRILSADIENTKAAIGEGLAPAFLEFLKVAGKVAGQVAVVTGALTNAQKALAELAPHTDKGKDSAYLFGAALNVVGHNINDFWGEVARGTEEGGLFRKELDSLWESTSLGRDEIQKLANLSVQELIDKFAQTKEQAEFLVDFFDHQLIVALTDTEENLRSGKLSFQNYGAAAAEAAPELEEIAEATHKAATRLEEFNSLVRSQVDPLFALVNAQRSLAEANQGVIDAQEEFGRGSPEYVDALLDAAEAGLDFKEALIRVATETHLTREAFESELQSMGAFTETQIADILTEFEKVNGFKFNDKDFQITVHGKVVVSEEIADKTAQAAAQAVSSTVSSVSSIKGAKAAGGPVEAGSAYLVGEKGPELFTPNQNGRIIPNNQIGSGGGITVNQTFERVAGENVAEDIQKGLLISGLSRYAEVG